MPGWMLATRSVSRLDWLKARLLRAVHQHQRQHCSVHRHKRLRLHMRLGRWQQAANCTLKRTLLLGDGVAPCPRRSLCPLSPPCHNTTIYSSLHSSCLIFNCRFTTKHQNHTAFFDCCCCYTQHIAPLMLLRRCCDNTLTVLRHTTLLPCCVFRQTCEPFDCASRKPSSLHMAATN